MFTRLARHKAPTAALAAALATGALIAAPPALAGDSSTWTVSQPGPAAQADLTADVTLDDGNGTLSLSVNRGDATVLEPSPLGVVADDADLTSGLQLLERTDTPVSESYSAVAGKQRERTVSMQESRFAFEGAGGVRMDLVVRVADDGVAYRYVLPEADPDGDGVAVSREASAFSLPGDSAAWLKGYSDNYERTQDAVTTATAAAGGEYAYPSLFQTGQEEFVLLTESDVDGRYAASRLVHEAGSNRYDVTLADEQIMADGSDGPLATPWRTAVIGSLETVTESTLVDDLAPASRVEDTSWIEPGTVAWSWLAGFGDAQRSLETQKEFVDYSAAHGWEYTLVDDGWKDTDWMPELIDYATERGVEILLWVHWTDVDTAGEREEFFTRITGWGAVGVKIDFMDSDSQERFRWYDDVLADTARHQLLVNFHGSTIPHGIQRTWPHVMSMEAVHGAEQGNVSAHDIATLPYTRNAVGSMDFTPMGFQFGDHHVSEAAELALSVVYESGQQNYAGSLDAYRQRPELERFLDQVPTAWDETQWVAGHPGDGATIARRGGDRWFIGSVNSGGAHTAQVPLDFLGDGSWRVETVRDADGGLVRDSQVMTGQDTLQVPVPDSGGFAAIACPDTPDTETCDQPLDNNPPGT